MAITSAINKVNTIVAITSATKQQMVQDVTQHNIGKTSAIKQTKLAIVKNIGQQ